MSVLYIVLPLAILLAIVAVVAFTWAVRSGQMDDLQTPALRVLHDDVLAKASDPSAPARPAPERRRHDGFSSTQAETPIARTRASLADSEPKSEATAKQDAS